MAGKSQRAARRAALIEKFRTLSAGRLERLNLAVVELEGNPGDAETAEEAMREIHTLKGEAKLLGFKHLNSLAHATEELMVDAQKRLFQVGREQIDMILGAFDAMSTLLLADGETGSEDVDVEEFRSRAERLLSGAEDAGSSADAASSRDEEAQEDRVEEAETEADTQEAESTESEQVETPKAETKPAEKPTSRPRSRTDGQGAMARLMQLRAAETLVIDVSKIDRLTELVGDLTQDHSRRVQVVTTFRERLEFLDGLARSALARFECSDERTGDPNGDISFLRKLFTEQREIYDELQERLAARRDALFEETLRLDQIEGGVREMRMLPLGSLFGAFPRAVRDLSIELGKQARVEIHGDHVMVDQRIHERLREPLLHLLRNCLDHGLEDTETRLAAGKPEVGRIRLHAVQRGAHLDLIVADDGAGIDLASLRSAAVRRGLLSAAQAEELDERESLRLLFRAGLSTRETATEISGRGVGMDIVKSQIESLGGSIRIDSEKGRGTTFELRLPASLAFQDVLVVAVQNTWWGIPVTSVSAIVYVSPEAVRSAAGSPVFEHDSEMLPLAFLEDLLSLPRTDDEASETHTAVVIEHNHRRCGLIVPRLAGQQALVRRHLDPFIRAQALVAGTAFAEGRAVLILNVAELLLGAMQSRPSTKREDASRESLSPVRGVGAVSGRLLVVDDSDLTRLMLLEILRGEGFDVREARHGREARDLLAQSLPDLVLLDLDMPVMNGFELLEEMRGNPETENLPVVVFSSRGSDEDKMRCVELGADAYLVKSEFQEGDLLETLTRFMSPR